MKNREPYQIIIMRPTGEKPVMTVRSFWVRLFLLSILLLVVAMVFVTIRHVDTLNTSNEQKQMITRQSEEMKDLNILLTRKDEEIISLKKKLSMTITHKAEPMVEIKSMPDLHPPIAEIAEIALSDGHLNFKLINIKAESQDVAAGFFYAVFKKGQEYICYPSVSLDNGVPMEKSKGISFSIRNFKPMSIKIPASMANWDSVIFYIFDHEEKLRLAMQVNKGQIQ